MSTRLTGREQVVIEPLARTEQVRDPDTGDTASAYVPRGAAFTLPAQVDERGTSRRSPTVGGARIPVDVELTLRAVDVQRAGYEPTSGDLVSAVIDRYGTSRAVTWYVVGYSRQGRDGRGGTYVVGLAGRQPSRDANEGA